MRKTLLAAGIGLLAWAGASQAAPVLSVGSKLTGTQVPGDFTINVDKIAGTGTTGNNPLAGMDIYRFYARFDPTSPTGLIAGGLQSAKVTLESNGNMWFKHALIDQDTTLDADVLGATISGPNQVGTGTGSATAVGTLVRVGDPNFGFNFQTVTPSSTLAKSDLDSDPDTGPEQQPFDAAHFGAVKSFRVEGFVKNPPEGQGFDPAGKGAAGNGAVFAILVVPQGSTFRAFGSLAADKGVIVDFDTAVPEPTTMSLIGIGASGALLLTDDVFGFPGGRCRAVEGGIACPASGARPMFAACLALIAIGIAVGMLVVRGAGAAGAAPRTAGAQRRARH